MNRNFSEFASFLTKKFRALGPLSRTRERGPGIWDRFIKRETPSREAVRADRRRFLTVSLSAIYALAVRPPATHAQDPADDRAAADLLTPAAQKAIRDGLEFLASRQNPDGSLGADGYRRDVAVVSLVGLAFLANGSAPGRGSYGQQVNRCVDYLLKNTDDSGFINATGRANHGPMYGHGFATLFLAEVYGMRPESETREKLVKAVKLIINAQNDEGGWRYQPERREADISVTICEVMALRARGMRASLWATTRSTAVPNM